MTSKIPAELLRAWDAVEAAPEPEAELPRQAERRQADRNGKGKGNGTAEGRFTVLNNFVDFTAATLKRADLLVWLVLYRDTKDGTAATAQTDIARRTGLGKRTVIYALQRLVAAGLVKRVHRGGLRRGASRYRVCGLRNDTE